MGDEDMRWWARPLQKLQRRGDLVRDLWVHRRLRLGVVGIRGEWEQRTGDAPPGAFDSESVGGHLIVAAKDMRIVLMEAAQAGEPP